MPLLSMDIFLEGKNRKLALAQDARAVRRLAKQAGWQQVPDLELMLLGKEKVVIITDENQNIVFASSNLSRMTGYNVSEVLGKTPRIFQGAGTEAKTKFAIRKALGRLQPFHVVLTNYKKNGQPYRCEIEAFPMINKHHYPVHFIAFENSIE